MGEKYSTGGTCLESTKLAQTIVDVLADKQSENIVMLDLRGLSIIADYFVITSGGSERQIKAITDAVEETLKEQKLAKLRVEGAPESGWVLLDYGDVVVHVFAPPEREYYKLELAWKQAPLVVHIQ